MLSNQRFNTLSWKLTNFLRHHVSKGEWYLLGGIVVVGLVMGGLPW